MFDNLRWRLWWWRDSILAWNWRRKRVKEYIRNSYPWKGQDD